MVWFASNPVKHGVKLIEKKDFKAALSLFSELVDKKNSPGEAHFYMGVCCFELGDLSGARTNLHLALDLNSSPDRVTEILELVNWNMVSSHKYFNSYHSFSPDGSLLAFSCSKLDTNGDGRINSLDDSGIFVTDLSTGVERTIVDNGSVNLKPVFSPDSRSIAYLSRKQTGAESAGNLGLYIVDTVTPEPRALSEEYNVKYHIFSADGRTIYFCGWKQGDKNSGIYALDIEKGSIATVVPGAYENTFPSLSPDGDKLLFASWRKDTNGDGLIDFRDNSGIYLKNLPDGVEEELVGEKYNSTFPVFFPDGNRILYLSVRRDTNGDGIVDSLDNAGIYVRELKNGREKCLVEDIYYNKFPSLTPGGEKLVFVSCGCKFRLTFRKNDFFEYKGVYLLDIEKNEFYQLVSEEHYGSRAPVVSPRGDKVAYVSWRKGTNRGLYVADISRLPSKEELHEWIEKNL